MHSSSDTCGFIYRNVALVLVFRILQSSCILCYVVKTSKVNIFFIADFFSASFVLSLATKLHYVSCESLGFTLLLVNIALVLTNVYGCCIVTARGNMTENTKKKNDTGNVLASVFYTCDPGKKKNIFIYRTYIQEFEY